jgi:Aerotolerance regulator N-terminal/von Willebrand factor type A domain
MSFLYPLFLIGAAAIAIPIALHLFRRRTETVVDFPAVRLLHKAPVEQQRRRKLRELILLALRVTALILLAFAFARPYLDRATGAVPAPTTAIALDTSLSLSAPGQFDAARQAARHAVETAPATHTVAFLAFADAATLLVPATTDRGSVLAAIDKVSVTAGGTRYRTALARAAEAVTSGEGRIVVVTDLQQAGWEAADEGAVPDGVAVEVVEIPPPLGNLAVTAARRDGQAVVAAVHNFGQRQMRVPVRLRLADRDLATQHIDVAAQSAAEVRLTGSLPLNGGAEVRVDDADGYQADNSRYVVLDPAGAVPVFVITSDPPGSTNAGLYVERALGVADEGRAFAVNTLDGRAFSALSAQQFGTPGALIVLGTSTLDRKGREMVAGFLRDGGRVLLTLGPDIDVPTLADTVGTHVDIDPQIAQTTSRTVTLIATDGRHPIFRPFSGPTGALGDVYMEQYRRLNDQSGRMVLARFSGAGSALTEQTVGRGRLLLFASDLDNRWNRFPLNPAFVPWAVETARYLTAGRDERQSYTLPDVPPGVLPAPGVHELASRKGVKVAVNPDVRESNLTRMTVEEFSGAITRQHQIPSVRAKAKAVEQEDRQRLWQVGLIVMFLALAGEGLIGRKAT